MSYIDMWINAFNFRGITKRRQYWIAVLINVLVFLSLSFVSAEAMLIYVALAIIPFLSMTIRRINDTDHSLSVFLWLLVPILGEIILLFILASLSRADKDKEFDRYHW